MSKKPRQPKAGEVLSSKSSAQLAGIPKQEIQRLIAIAESYQGPLPKASEFAAYERVQTGAADRIIRMAEKALGAEIFSVRADKYTELTAMLLSRLFLYALLGSAVYLVMHDKPVEAAFAGLAPIISVIYSTFKSGESSRSKTKAQKKQGS